TLPLRALRQQVDHVMPPQQQELATLSEQLAAAGWQDVLLLLVLDGFEQHLRAPAERADIAHFDLELARCLLDPAVPMHVLIVGDDDAMRSSLERYERWMPSFGRHWLRLPNAPADAEALWSDTQIDPVRDGNVDADDPTPLEPREQEAMLDLSLEEPAATPPAVGRAQPVDLQAATAVPDDTAPAVGRANAPPPPVPPPLTTLLSPPPTAPPWPPRDDAAAAAPSGRGPPAALPSWAVEPDEQAMRDGASPAPWWRRGSLRPLADAAVLVAGIWLVVTWLVSNERTPPPPLAPPAAPTVPPPVATELPPVAPAAAPPAPPLPPSKPMTITRPLDGGTALIDELVREVAAPAGVPLSVVPPQAEATLAVWRHDALLSARGSQSPPLRVLAPLFSEQVQIVVRSDAPWDYVREIKGLRLNIGPPGSARARTARTLYESMFGAPLAPERVNELDEAAALRHLLRRDGPIDAMVVVSELPLLNRLPPDARAQLRELPFDANDGRTAGALQVYPLKRRSAGERPRLAVSSFLVTGAAPHPYEDALQTLVVAVCRAQPALQARGSLLLRGFAQGEQPEVGWPYVLPRRADSGCPGTPPTPETARSGTPAQTPPRRRQRPAAGRA
ncbi:MAG TPA: TAXI family TRAP transporter solute-binding subunit, partial [Burkholderiaceae bacterium]|nr:TAXI family TRAP transporter solute-binding subunit [Burkholderiaceae bacterium]